MATKERYGERLRRLRGEMVRTGLSALLISRPENRRYMSGFEAADEQLDESSGRLFITLRRAYLLTDSRYEIQARREATAYEVEIYRVSPIQTLAALARRHRVTRMGFEEDHLTVAFHKEMRRVLKGVGLASAAGLVERLRQIKDASEVRLMERALRITEEALAKTFDFLVPGRSELEVARFLEEAMTGLGADGVAFKTIVASGPNAAMPHAVPTNRRIKASETVIFDCGAMVQGYRADITRTIILGRPRPWMKAVYRTVRQAQLKALEGIRPGLHTDQADALAREIIEEAGYGPQFGHALGHGVGLAIHEAPAVSRMRPVALEPGMVITVEPGVYVEGRGGVRLEEMVLLTEDGLRLLNRDRTFYDF